MVVPVFDDRIISSKGRQATSIVSRHHHDSLGRPGVPHHPRGRHLVPTSGDLVDREGLQSHRDCWWSRLLLTTIESLTSNLGRQATWLGGFQRSRSCPNVMHNTILLRLQQQCSTTLYFPPYAHRCDESTSILSPPSPGSDDNATDDSGSDDESDDSRGKAERLNKD